MSATDPPHENARAPLRRLAGSRPIILIAIRNGALQQIALKATDQLEAHSIIVASGEAALRVLESVAPSVIVVGAELEDVFCFELTELIRAAPEFAGTRVLLLSERVATSRLVRDPSEWYQADRWVDSTVDPSQLAHEISTLLSSASDSGATCEESSRTLSAQFTGGAGGV